MTLCWLVGIFNYYVISFQVKYLPGDFNENTIVMYSAELLFYVLGSLLISNINTRYAFATTLIMQSIAGTLMVVTVQSPTDKTGPFFLFL